MHMLLKVCRTVAFLLVASAAPAWAIGPSFDCNSVRTPPAQIICSSPDLSRTDLEFVQAYYALRQQVGPAGWQALKMEAIAFGDQAPRQCGIPLFGPALPSNSTLVACLQQAYERQRDAWRARLTGPAAEEASRSIEEHVALQRDLQALGFLPSTEKIG